MTIFGVSRFCGYLFGVTSNFDNFYGLFFKINYCNLCSVMRFTQLSLNIMGRLFMMICLGFAKTLSIFGGMLEIPDIFGGPHFRPCVLGVQSRCWGPAYVPGKSQSTPMGAVNPHSHSTTQRLSDIYWES